MIVTGIEPVHSSRVKIYMDDEFAFVLYKGELRSYGIAIGKEVTEETYERILKEVLSKRAKKRAMALLTVKPYTESKLREKLVEGEYPSTIIEEAISYVKSYHYVDDVMYAKQYFETYRLSKSILRMKNDLRSKGVSAKDMEEALSEIEDSEDGGVDEGEQIRTLLEKRHFNASTATYEETQKMMAFLMRRGYSMEKIRKELRGFEEEI